MYPRHPPHNPAARGGYVPYFYEAGLYLFPSLPGRQPSQTGEVHAHAGYDFSSDVLYPRQMPRRQTVEQVVERGYLAIPRGEAETALITDRKHTSWLGLEDFISQIRSRQELYRENLYELEQGVCEANNAVFRQEADQGAPANEEQRDSANKVIQKLYEQKRTERIDLWRDVSRLRQSLPEAAQQYLAAYRKVSILEDNPGDGP